MPSIPRELRNEGRRAAPVFIAVPVMILVVWGAGILVIHSRINRWDLSAIKWFAAHRTPWLNRATDYGTYLAETIPVIVILLIAIVLARRWTHGWRTPLFLAVVVAGEKIVYIASSTLVHRARPPLPTLDDTYATSSFPSGHVGSAITLYGAIAIAVGAWKGRKYLYWLLALMFVFACTVAFCRMYRGFHYPSDCISGALVGSIWMTLTIWVMHPLAEHRTASAAEPVPVAATPPVLAG